MIAYIPLIFVIIGLLMYALCANPKLAEIGRLVFFAAFLVLMFSVSSETVHFLAGKR